MASLESVTRHLCRHYGVGGRLERVPKGRADNYCVDAGGSRWLFKVFQADYTLSRIERAAEFLSFVVSRGYPAREFARTVDGARVLALEERPAVLIPWIEGHTPEPNTVTSAQALAHLGALCGRLHRLAAAYPHAHALEYSGSSRSLADAHAALRRLLEAGGEIALEARTRLEILDALGEKLEAARAHARRGIIHGDFSASHVVFRHDEPAGVIDVVGELYLPGWELMRAFFQSVPSSSLDGIEPPWRAFVGGYVSEHPISCQDIEIAYDTYLLQLTSSTYGLRKPLDDQLRAFGRWRTATAQHLASRRGELREIMARTAA